MSKIAIFAFCLFTAVIADSETFTGIWTPVAVYPNISDGLDKCFTTVFTTLNKQCTCEDGKEVQVAGLNTVEEAPNGHFLFPMLVIYNPNEVASSLNVTCTCEGRDYPNRAVVRSVNSNYFIIYKAEDKKPDEVISVLLARDIPSHQKVLDDVKGIEDLNGRDGAVVCDSEIAAREATMKRSRGRQSTRHLFFP